MASNFHKTGKWDVFRRSVDPSKFKARERAMVAIATAKNGMYVAGQMKRRLRGGGWDPNADLTKLIKGSSKPLVDHGQLFQSHTFRVIDWKTVFVGIMKQSRTAAGTSLVNVAESLHDGATIKVTPKMRAMFWYLWLATSGRMKREKLSGRAAEIYERVGTKRVIKPLNPATTAIRVPGRPWIAKVFMDASVHAVVKRNWVNAIAKALKAT